MALRAAQFDQAAATDRGVDIHVCSVDIRVDVRPGRVFNGANSPCRAPSARGDPTTRHHEVTMNSP